MPYDREKLAWAAGFFDGEGCTTFHLGKGTQYYYPRLRIGQSGNSGYMVLETFKDALQMGSISGPYSANPTRYPNRQVTWSYYLHGFEKVQAAIALMWTWLSDAKKEQAIKILTHERNQNPLR